MRRVVLAVAVVTVAACGDQTARTTTDEPAPDSDQRYTATAMVLESPDHGPQLCLGGVEDSLPPQCGGPDIPNWSWDDVDGFESAGGTTWGGYTVVGTYDGEDFTLTEQPTPPAEPDDPVDPQFWTPCDEPPGGWTVVEEATATEEAMTAAIEYAASQPDHAGTWLDQSMNPALSGDTGIADAEIEAAANDPTKLILNFRFSGDLERHERELREIWGGALCVTRAEHTEDELRDVQRRLHGELGDDVLGSGIDVTIGYVELMVVVDDGSLQRELDEQYGEGVVRVHSALRPVG